MCVFTDKKVKKTLAFALVPIVAINVYAGSKILEKTLTEEVKESSEQAVIVTVNDYVVTSPSDEVDVERSEFEKLYDMYILSSKSIEEILNTEDKNSELYISALYVKLRNANIPDEVIKQELDNIMILGYSYTDISEEEWLSLFGNILPTISYEENVMDYYYPLAKYIHSKDCSLEHNSEYEDGRIGCDSLQEQFNNMYQETTYLNYVVDMVYATQDDSLIIPLERILNSPENTEICLYELENIYEMAKVPMCVPEDIWNSQFEHLLTTVTYEENVCEVYYELACFVHMLMCDYEHSITEFGTFDCDVKEVLIKNL